MKWKQHTKEGYKIESGGAWSKNVSTQFPPKLNLIKKQSFFFQQPLLVSPSNHHDSNLPLHAPTPLHHATTQLAHRRQQLTLETSTPSSAARSLRPHAHIEPVGFCIFCTFDGQPTSLPSPPFHTGAVVVAIGSHSFSMHGPCLCATPKVVVVSSSSV